MLMGYSLNITRRRGCREVVNTSTVFFLLSHLLFVTHVCEASPPYTEFESIVRVGQTSVYKHDVRVFLEEDAGLLLYEGEAIIEVSRPDFDTLSITALKSFNSPTLVNSLVSSPEGTLVIRTLGGRISSILKSASLTSWTLNYLRAVVSTLFVYKDYYSLSYYTVTDSFGTCEVAATRNNSTLRLNRDLTRCSHSSSELTLGAYFIPVFHVGVDLSGSESSCSYQWLSEESLMESMERVDCRDELHISQRFSQDSEFRLKVTSVLQLLRQESIHQKVNDRINSAKESTTLITDPRLNKDTGVEKEELDSILRRLCATSKDHLTKESFLISSEAFYALNRLKKGSNPDLLRYPCPANIRRLITYAAALIGGPRYLRFVHDQMSLLMDDGLDLLPLGLQNPIATIALSNLGESALLSPEHRVSPEFFIQRENVAMYQKILEMLLVSGPALPGVTGLLQKLRTLSPTLFEDTMIKASVILSPEADCAAGNTEQATRILHAVGSLSVRATTYVASLRPCFATEDVGVQVAAMRSLLTLDCDTPGLLELEQLAVESPSDPEIRMAAFKGLVRCLPGRPTLIPSLQSTLDEDNENYSLQVASFAWSYIRATLASTNPDLIDIQLELEDVPGLLSLPDPVTYEPRQHSRHLERNFILDPRTAVSGVLELVWGRASPAPRSLLFGATVLHDGVAYPFFEVSIRVTGVEEAVESIPYLKNVWSFLSLAKNRAWNVFMETAQQYWRDKRHLLQHETLQQFLNQVIAGIPADFQSSGSSFEVSLSLFGIPAFHSHHRKLDEYLASVPENILRLIYSNFHLEAFDVFPLLDNNVVLGTSGGIPVNLRLAAGTGLQTLFSHFVDDRRGSVDFVASGGLTFETSLKLGFSEVELRNGATSLMEVPKFRENQKTEMFSDVTMKRLWSFDLPLSFSYNLKESETVLKFRRPTSLPHFAFQAQGVAYLSGKPFPMRFKEKCLVDDEEINLCVVTSTPKTYANELQLLNNKMMNPRFFGLKFVIPKGYEPVIFHITGPEQTPGRSVVTLRVKIPKDEETLSYEALVIVYSTVIKSVAFSFHSPHHKYYIKGYWSLTTRERWLLGMEVSLDEELRDLKFHLSFPKVANQRIITPVLSLVSTPRGEEELFRAFIALKQFPESSSIELSGATHGPLAHVFHLKVTGEARRAVRNSLKELFLEELRIKIPNREEIFFDAKFSQWDEGTDFIFHANYGTNYDTRVAVTFRPVDLGPSAHLLPAKVREKVFGGTYTAEGHLKHPRLQSPSTFAVFGFFQRGEFDFDGSLKFGNSTTRATIFIMVQSVADFKVSLSLAHKRGDLKWSFAHDLVWSAPDYKIGLNGTWLTDKKYAREKYTQLAFFIHFINDADSIDHTLHLAAEIVGPKNLLVKITHDFSRATVAGSYKHKLQVDSTPGRDIAVNTVVVSGSDPSMVTYGLSMNLKLEDWDHILRIVGAANCMRAYTKCDVNTVVSQGPENLGEFEVKFTGSADGISRTDVRIAVENYLNLESSVDAILTAGTVKVRLFGELVQLERRLRGTGSLQWDLQWTGEAQIYAFTLQDDIEVVTHYYNASLLLDPQTRTLLSRHELRGEEVDGNVVLWAAIVQGKIGISIFNDSHFAKVVFTTPEGRFYSLGIEASSEVVPRSLVVVKTVLATDIGDQNHSYLLGWDLYLGLDSKVFEKGRNQLEGVGDSQGETELIALTTLGRLKTPTTGEMKFSVKAKRSLVFHDNPHYSNVIEVRLVKESFPELGRVNAKLTHNREAYSASMRIWSGSRSASLDTYGVAREQSLKNSLSLTLIDPTASWQLFESKIEADHIGTLPFNFQSSIAMSAEMHRKRMGSLKALAQWTSSTAALNFDAALNHWNIPATQIFFKWTFSSFVSKMAVLDLRTGFESQWRLQRKDGAAKLDLVWTFAHPQFSFRDLDSTFNFEFEQGESMLLPKTAVLKGRLSIKAVRHWMVSIEHRRDQGRAALQGAIIRPVNPASVSLEFIAFEDGGFHFKSALVLDSNSHHVTTLLTSLNPGDELSIIVRSTFLAEKNGYILRVWKRTCCDPYELGIVWSEGTDSPLWNHIYRLRCDVNYINEAENTKQRAFEEKKLVEGITLEDFYVYRENQKSVSSKRFLLLQLDLRESQEHQLYDVTIQFPEWVPNSPLEGTVEARTGPSHRQNELDIFLRMEVPDNDHVVQIKYTYDESPFDWQFSRIVYRQRLIKGLGHPLRFELEANNFKGDKKDLNFSLHKLFLGKTKESRKKPRKGTSLKGDAISFRSYQGRLVITKKPSFHTYKLSWETDGGSRNDAEATFEFDSSGVGGHLKYERKSVDNPDIKQFILLKGNYKEFPSEVTCSVTLEHLSIGRPRSLTFLHSLAEDYTEVILDIYRSDQHQIIAVLNLQEQFTFTVGQFGSNLVQISHSSSDQDGLESNEALQSTLVEIGGYSVDFKLGKSANSNGHCHWVSTTTATPETPQVFNTITICPAQKEFIIQILGLERNEGPYIRVGEISGPGGGGLQLGGGRLYPLNTPPALTLTGDKKERHFEVLFDLQVTSLNQLSNDLKSRTTDLELLLEQDPKLRMNLKGVLALEKATKDFEGLIEETLLASRQFKEEIFGNLDDGGVVECLNNATEWLRRTKSAVQKLIGTKLPQGLVKYIEAILLRSQELINRKRTLVLEVLDLYRSEAFKFLLGADEEALSRIGTSLRALRYNDNQSLYALVSRATSRLHTSIGRKKGVQGFIVNEILTKFQQMVASWLSWENLRKEGLSTIRAAERVTSLKFHLNHDTGFALQVPPLKTVWRDVLGAATVLKKKSRGYLEYAKRMLRGKVQLWRARILASTNWKVQGTATIIGWEQAISWDGRFLSPLLSDTCPHVLVLLTRFRTPTAITLHLLHERKVFTFYSRQNRISVDSNLQVKINGKVLGSSEEDYVIGDLRIRKLVSHITIASSEGITLECFIKGDLCYIAVEKRNFANTAGILGVFDFERNTDFMTSAWERPASVSAWVNSWKVSDSETCETLPAGVLHNWSLADLEERCSHLFSGEQTSFSVCMKRVTSRPYEASCREGKFCSSEEAMKRMCDQGFLAVDEESLSCGIPRVQLVLAEKNEASDENESRLECQVEAEPPIYKIQFLKNEMVLESNFSYGLHISGNTLILQEQNPWVLQGKYSCTASNSIGSSQSNFVLLDIKHKPICTRGRKEIRVIGGEMVALECQVLANPPEVSFSWSIDNGGEHDTRLSESTFTSFGLVSRLKFVPKSQSEFGRVLCWAANEMGRQQEPCQFLIKPGSGAEKCTHRKDERRGTEELSEEVVFLGDFSCLDSVPEIVSALKDRNRRKVRLVLRYTKEPTPSQSDFFHLFDEVIPSLGQHLLELVSKSVQEDFSEDSLRAIIIFHCESQECQSMNEDDLNTLVFLSKKLRQIGLQLYTVTKEPFQMSELSKVPNKVKKQLLGIDRKTAYMMSHARKKNLKGKRGVRKYLSIPENNICAELSLQTDGAVFSLKALKKLRKKHHKKLFNEIIGLRLLRGHNKEYLDCRTCACHRICNLCSPVPPVESEIFDIDGDEEDYDDDYFYT